MYAKINKEEQISEEYVKEAQFLLEDLYSEAIEKYNRSEK